VQNSLKGSIPDIMNRLRAALDNALEAAVWQTSKGAADIVDTGALKRSLTMTSTPDGIEISYRAPYASLVHYGGYVLPYGNTNADKVYIPPRPWLQSVMQGGGPVVQFNLEAVLREAISTALS
jgi:phage gpG-like protein